jgi:hypothetical protein
LFFATIETVCTLIIIRQAWTWSSVEVSRSPSSLRPQSTLGVSAQL